MDIHSLIKENRTIVGLGGAAILSFGIYAAAWPVTIPATLVGGGMLLGSAVIDLIPPGRLDFLSSNATEKSIPQLAKAPAIEKAPAPQHTAQLEVVAPKTPAQVASAESPSRGA